MKSFARLRNATAIPRAEVPCFTVGEFFGAVADGIGDGARVAALFGDAETGSREVHLYAVLADEARSLLRVGHCRVEGERFRSLTPTCPQVHLFEREVAEQFGLVPEGHPWLKPVRFHTSYRSGFDAWGRPEGEAGRGVMDYYRVDGRRVHEVAVGPVHAGIIEPGHFRFQCHGKRCFTSKSRWATSTGGSNGCSRGTDQRTLAVMEEVGGDTSVGHATAYCQAVEALSGCYVPVRGDAIRSVSLELERLANHTGDLRALSGDVGFLPTASYVAASGDFLNLSALLCGAGSAAGWCGPVGLGSIWTTRARGSSSNVSTRLCVTRPGQPNSSGTQPRFRPDSRTLER